MTRPCIFTTAAIYNWSRVSAQPLAGSTLDDVSSFSSCALLNMNAHGQVVYQFELSDDRTGILLFTPDSPATTGDFNEDGIVDAADYVV
jgi:hypothetical protein